jgi:hypothetical protein
VAFSDTSTKFQDLLVVLDDNTLLLELKKHVQIYDVSIFSVSATTRDKVGIGYARLTKNWGIGIEASKRMRLVTTIKSRMGDRAAQVFCNSDGRERQHMNHSLCYFTEIVLQM